MTRLSLLLTTLTALVLAVPASAADDQVELIREGDRVRVTIGDELFTVYNFGESLPKPYLLPVVADGGLEAIERQIENPSEDEFAPGTKVTVVAEKAEFRVTDKNTGTAEYGEVLEVGEVQEPWLWIPEKDAWIHASNVAPHAAMVTRQIIDEPNGIKDRNHPLYYDHPHHKGVWVSVDEVNGVKFWNEDGRIEVQNVEILEPSGNPARLRVTNHWKNEEGKPLVEEQTTISFFANRLMVYDIRFQPVDDAVTFDDTKEGMFGIRLPNSMREMVGGGDVTNADGAEGTSEAWGRASNWVDYTGTVGEERYGVTIMDHPENFRPSRYHVRNYGLFSINPFGEQAYTKGSDDPQEPSPVTLQPGESLSLRYGLWVHPGNVDKNKVEQAYDRFVTLPASESR